jgi:hypothetical protein
MEKIIVLLFLLVTSQAWAGASREPSTEAKELHAKATFVKCQTYDELDWELRKLKADLDNCGQNCKRANIVNGRDSERQYLDLKNKNVQDMSECEDKLDELIKQAVKGDDAIYDGLMSSIDKYASGGRSQKIYADKYRSKLEMAQQRAILKAKQ